MIDRSQGVRCMLMRGGSSKGAFFLAEDLPQDPSARDDLLLKVMGSPHRLQVDGVGGAHPLTSKVAVVSTSERPDVDLEYLFLQVAVDQPSISDRQNCGNMLAAVAPFATERGLLSPPDGKASARILMLNTGKVAEATFPVSQGAPVYQGDTEIAGVPGRAAEITIEFHDVAGSSTGALLPTGNTTDQVDGVETTLIDAGMPVVVMRATDLGMSGYESCEELESSHELRERLERIRLAAGPLMNLGDVTEATVPKLTLVSPPREGGAVCTRTFIPHRCHASIGVLGAISVATSCMLPDSPAAEVARVDGSSMRLGLEHPTGIMDTTVAVDISDGPVLKRAGIIRTARKLMDGIVYPRPYD